MMPNPLSTPMPAVPGVLQYGDVANLKGENGKFLSSTKGTCTLDAPGRSEEADFGLVHISKGGLPRRGQVGRPGGAAVPDHR